MLAGGFVHVHCSLAGIQLASCAASAPTAPFAQPLPTVAAHNRNIRSLKCSWKHHARNMAPPVPASEAATAAAKLRTAHYGPNATLSYSAPVHMVAGSGSTLMDDQGTGLLHVLFASCGADRGGKRGRESNAWVQAKEGGMK